MAAMNAPSQPALPTVLLFGDQTDPWVDGLDQLFQQAASTLWLKLFLEQLADAINDEIRSISVDSALQASLGRFSSLQELGERHRYIEDDFGVVRAILLHAIRASTLLQWVKRKPRLLLPESRTQWLGISAGLVTLSALAAANDFDSLCDACLDTGRVLVRLCKLTSVRSRAVEDRPGSWGWAVLGIRPDHLRDALDQYQRSAGVPSSKKAKVGVIGAGWSTLIGPPSTLELFINQCPAVKGLANNPLNIKALQHSLTISSAELDFMVGIESKYLDAPTVHAMSAIWGMDDPMTSYQDWRSLLRAVCLQVLARPLDIPRAVAELDSSLEGLSGARILQLSDSSHAPYVASVLKTGGKNITVQDQRSLLRGENGGTALKSGRVAIVGMAGRGPGSDNVDEFWDLIMSKQDLCTEIPKDRFNVDDFYCAQHERGDQRCKMTTRYGCFMNNPGHFDSRFFHISPREALLMDPAHRQFLMSTYEALEMAGYSDGKTRDTDPNRIAAFFGQCTDDWLDHSHPSLGCDAYTLQAVQRAFGPGRLAWQFKWEGPTYSLDSACASTTAGIHLACMSLLSKDIDMAVAGAGNILSYPHSFTCLSDSGVLSDTGNCKTFRDDADGYCRAEFVGAVVLKRLEDAIAHNDNILAVVAGSGRNHSGNSTSITTSDALAQERLFQKVMRNASATPDDISYVEMHGTGTQIGDPAEMGAVSNTFKHRRRTKGPLPIGGTKANFGHSEAAAGMAELLKCVMMFQKDTIPPQAGIPHTLNPKFPPLEDLNIEIPSEPKPFEKGSDGLRRILLNNFDAAGGNACMLLEDYTAQPCDHQSADPRSGYAIAVSARAASSYHENIRKLTQWLKANPSTRVEDVAYTTTARRMHHPYRFSCHATSTEELISKLEASSSKDLPSSMSHSPPMVFSYTGQGSHYAGMGAELYRTNNTFREAVDLCATISKQNAFPEFIDILTDDTIDIDSKSATQVQLSVVTLEIALTIFWRSIGIEPAMVIGHSLGEYAALHAAGVLSLADTLFLVAQRAVMLQERCESGSCGMLSVSAPLDIVQDHLNRFRSSTCAIACVNSPNATVVSGAVNDLANLQANMVAQDSKLRSKMLSVPFAFHSFQVDPILRDYGALAETVTFSQPRIPVASTLLASIIDSPGTFNSDYLVRQTRQAVDFVGGLNAISSKLKDPAWLELGPAPVCTSFVRATQSSPFAKTMHSMENSSSNWTTISRALSSAYMAGFDVDWMALHKPYENFLKLLALPRYAWNMKDYWVPFSGAGSSSASEKHLPKPIEPLLGSCAQYLVQKSSSPNISVTFRAAINDPIFLSLIEGHKMQEVGLASGSVFCDAALTVAKYALEYSGRNEVSGPYLTLHNPELLAPLTKSLVGLEGQLLTTAIMKSRESDTVSVTFEAKSAETSHNLGSITVNVRDPKQTQVEWDRVSYFIKAKMDERIQKSKEGAGHRMQPEVVYALFANAVEFDAHFQGIQEAYLASDFQEAAAIIELPQEPAGSRFTSSPYWSEALVHLAGFMVNGNPRRSARTTFIVMGFESSEQTAAFQTGKQYLTYTRISRWVDNTAYCDAYVFEAATSRMIMHCHDLRYTELPRAAWRLILEGGVAASAKPSRMGNSAPHGDIPAVKVVESDVSGSDISKTAQQELMLTPVAPKTSEPALFERIMDSILSSTGSDRADITDQTQISELGVDSIMAIEIVSNAKLGSGIDLPATFVFDYPTVGDLRRAFGAGAPPGQSTQGLRENPSPRSSVYTPPSSGPPDASPAESISSEDSGVMVSAEIKATPTKASHITKQTKQPEDEIDRSSPAPSVRITLLQGRSGPGKTPFYLMADGTGSIASYMHLPPFKSKIPVYGVDSPFLRCPTRLTTEVGIEGAAKLIVEAMIAAYPKGPLYIGGYSAGCVVAFETCRQLAAIGRKVEGLILIDLCAPRSTDLDLSAIKEESKVGVSLIGTAVGAGSVWGSAASRHDAHLRAYFMAMRLYDPPPMAKAEQPARTAVIWAEKGLINRVRDDPKLVQMLKDHGFPTEAYPRYMEDPKLSPTACLIPNKGKADLGPNGWDNYTGDVLTLSVDADHLDLPTPPHVRHLHAQLEKALDHFGS